MEVRVSDQACVLEVLVPSTEDGPEGDYVCLNEDIFPVRRDLLRPKYRDRKKMATVNTAELEIPIWVKGTQKWVTGLTKRTTCDDVIYALLYQEGMHEAANTSAYAIFEKWKEVERPLQGRTKIIKVWRTWGAEQANVHLSMKRIDELEYSGEFSLTRRKKRSRHKSRDRERERDRHPKDHRNGGHNACHNASDRLRSMETLVKLVISQERKLKDIDEHADDTDKLIERYESKLHARRLKQNGEDYLQDAYLDSNSEDNMDDFFSKVNIEELELYVEYCDKIIALEDRISNEYSKIEDLSFQIQKCSNEQSTSAQGADPMAVVQGDLNRAVSCAIMQQYKYQDLQRELQFYEEKLEHKDAIQTRLQEELDELESRDVSVDSFDSASSGRTSLQGSRDTLKSPKNPPPLPERVSRAPVPEQLNPLPPLPERKVINPLPVPERKRHKPEVANSERKVEHRNGVTTPNPIHPITGVKETVVERKPILKPSSELRNGYMDQNKPTSSETKVRFSTDTLVDKYYWEESSSEGISIDHSDCSDSKDLFECPAPKRGDNYTLIKSGVADKPYLTVKVEDNDSNSDTGLSSMHSDDSAVYHLETLV